MNPTALLDQIDAASADAERRLMQAGDTLGKTPVYGVGGPWLLNRQQRFAIRQAFGHVQACRHVGHSPQVVYVLAWDIDRVYCAYCCFGAIRAMHGQDEDTRCDVCRKRGRKLHSGAIAVGPVVVNYGVCQPCLPQVIVEVTA